MKKTFLAFFLPALLGCASAAHPAATAPGDPELLGLLEAFHQVQMRQASAAAERSSSPQVRALAASLGQNHRVSLARTSEYARAHAITPGSSAVTAEFETNAARTIDVLRTWRDGGFDRTFLDAVSEQLEWLLQSLDEIFIPRAEEPLLREILQELRDSASLHLEQAVTLRAEL